MTAARQLFHNHPDTYLDELQWFLAIHHDIAISISSLQENLQKAGLTRKLLHKIAIERDEEARRNFQLSLRQDFSGTGDEFVVTDESSKDERVVARRYGRSLVNTDADIREPFIQGQRYTLIAAMDKTGYIAARVIPDAADSFDYFNFVVEDVVSASVVIFFPSLSRLHRYL